MNSLPETWVCFCAIAFVTGNSLVQASDDDSRDDSSNNKRDDGVLRLGRGLQMLRLGKRSANLDSLNFGHQDQTDNRLSSNDIQAVLASIFDQPRDESRRQPPLPRYGRDSNSNIKGRLLVDAIADDSGIYPPDLLPFSSQRFFFRPAPRGGRYRRSFPMGRFAYVDYLLQNSADRTRTPASPWIEHFIQDMAHLQPKAVPRPRIGRYPGDQTGSSFQNKLV